MNSSARFALACGTLTTLVACGSPSPHPRDKDGTQEAARDSAAPGNGTAEETVFDDMLQTKDRARAVEGVTLESKAATDRAIAASEGGGSGAQGGSGDQ
jgi:hypothetical protein